MAGKQAKVLSLSDVSDLLVFASCTRHPFRNRLIVLLAAKAGLRASEIAKLTWDMVLDPTGDIGSVIELRDAAAKNGGGRLIPMHPDLRLTLAAYRSLSTGMGPVIRSERGGAMTPSASCAGSPRPIAHIGLKAAPPIPAAAPSSPEPPGWSTRPVGHCATCSFWPVTGRSRPPSDTSTATPMPNASSYR